jgi:hypothetical protein
MQGLDGINDGGKQEVFISHGMRGVGFPPASVIFYM